MTDVNLSHQKYKDWDGNGSELEVTDVADGSIEFGYSLKVADMKLSTSFRLSPRDVYRLGLLVDRVNGRYMNTIESSGEPLPSKGSR